MITEQPTPSPSESKSGQVPFRINKLGHVVLFVKDIERSLRFYTEVLPFRLTDVNEGGMRFLSCGGDHHTLALVPRPEGEMAPTDSVRMHHFAMEVDSMETLFKIRDWLKQHDVEFVYEGRRGPGSNPGIEFLDPDGYALELYAEMDQVDWDAASRPAEQWSRAKSLEDVVANPLPQWPAPAQK